MINVDRSVVEEPEIGKHHRSLKILDALEIVFLNKCYLCESKYFRPDNCEVDHFVGQCEDENKKLKWTNFYLSCGDCNRSKPKKTPKNGYLDVCKEEDDVEIMIGYSLDEYDYDKPVFYPTDSEPTQKTLNTINLLERFHDGHDANTRRKTASLREAIRKQACILITEIAKHQKAEIDKNQRQIAVSLDKIKRCLSRESPFTMLMRDIGKRYGYEHLFD